MIYPTTKSPPNHTHLQEQVMTLVMQLMETQRRVREQRIWERTRVTRQYGGKWILVECTAFTVSASCLKTTTVMVSSIMKYTCNFYAA